MPIQAVAVVTSAVILVGRIILVGARAVRGRQFLLMPDMYQTLVATVGAAWGRQFVGAWSRVGLYHPGPAWFYWAAPFVRVFGTHPSVLFLAALVLVAACVLAATGLVWRHLGEPSALVAVMVLAWCIHQLSVEGLAFPWNPTVAILPTTLGVVAVASVLATGSRTAAVLGVLSGTFVAQTHIGSLPLGGLIVVVCLLAVVWWRRRDGRCHSNRIAAMVLLLCTVLPWVPVGYDQLTGSGNLGAVMNYGITGRIDERFPASPPSVTRELSARGTVSHYAALASLTESRTAAWGGADFLAGLDFRPKVRSVAVLAVLIVFAAVGAMPRRRQLERLPDVPPLTRWLCRAALVGAAVQWFALLRVRSEFRHYLVAATMGTGVALWMAAALTCVAVLSVPARRLRPRSRQLLVYGTCTVAVLAMMALVQLDGLRSFPGLRNPPEDHGPIVASLRAQQNEGITFLVDDVRVLNDQMQLAAVLGMSGRPPRVEGELRAHFSDYNRNANGGTVVRFVPLGEATGRCEVIGQYAESTVCIEN